MRKWTYLVAALLMSGTAATFTSCIDNMEPAGIEAMRTAKAEFYYAQARLKDAETAYKNAQAQGEIEKAKQQAQLARQMELANDLLAAQTELDKESIKLELDRVKAEYLVKMKEQETALKQAEEEYLIALKEFNITAAKVNSEYTTMLSSILSRITANRAQRELKSVELTQAQLDLSKFATNSLDTATVRGGYERNIAIHENNVERYKAELEILKTLSGANSEAIAIEATNIEKEIRTKVEEFNKTVDEYSKNKTEYTNKNNELAALEAKLGAGYTEQMKADATLTLKVGENIQNDFIKALTSVNKPGRFSDKIFDLNSLDDSKVKTENLTPYEEVPANIVKYYTLIGDFTITADENIVTGATSETNNTSYKLNETISSIRSQVYSKIKTLLGTSTDLTNFEKVYQEFITTQTDKENYLTIAEKNYNNVSEDYYKEETGTLAKYLDAKSAYMYNATSYYKLVDDYIKKIYSPSGTPATPTLTPTEEQVTTLIDLIKEYATKREALDGWVAMTGTDKAYTKLTKTSTYNDFVTVLGAETLVTTNEDSPYAKAYNASVAMFGGTSIVLENPDVATEYRYKEATISSSSPSGTSRYSTGLFNKYLTAYEAVQKIKMLEEYVALDDALTARSNELLAKVFEFKNQNDAIASNAEVIALETEIKDLLDKLELGHADILLTSTNRWNPNTIANAPGKLTVERATADAPTTGNTSGTYSLDNIDIYQGSNTTAITTLGGYLGAHILNLQAYFNNLNAQNNTYDDELEDMEDLLAYEQSQLAVAKQTLAEFKAGGYVITLPAGSTPIKIGDGATSYVEVELLEEGTQNERKEITYKQWNPNTNDYETIYTSVIYPTNPNYNKIGGSSVQGQNIEFTPDTNYLKAIIEAYEAQKDILDAQIKDLDATYEILLKERDQFMSTINSLYQ